MILDWAQTIVSVISAGTSDAFCESNYQTTPNAWRGWFRNHVLWWVKDGEAILNTRKGRACISGNTAIWFRPGFEYKFDRIPTPLHLQHVHFCLLEKKTHRRLDRAADIPEILAPDDPAFVSGIISRITSLCERVPGETLRIFRANRRERAERLLIEGLIELLDNVSSDHQADAQLDPMDQKLVEIATRITTMPQRGYSVKELADEVGLSVARFTIRFERVNRKKPAEFIISQRIQLASQLLAETALPIGEIAFQSGYSSVYYFSRQFKSRTGAAPRDFRGKQNSKTERDRPQQ